jgi:photosystem II stability/assembly factor-like uncharacterized protein
VPILHNEDGGKDWQAQASGTILDNEDSGNVWDAQRLSPLAGTMVCAFAGLLHGRP